MIETQDMRQTQFVLASREEDKEYFSLSERVALISNDKAFSGKGNPNFIWVWQKFPKWNESSITKTYFIRTDPFVAWC